jgi:hypothetical protein
MRALFVLTPTESKKLIGKAVAGLQEVKNAIVNDRMVIGHGSTCVYVAEEILGKRRFCEAVARDSYLSGCIQHGVLCTIPGKDKGPILVLNRGEIVPPAPTMSELLREFGSGSVFIKGANAVDPEGNAAVFMAHPEGGTIGWSIGTIVARGITLIVPVGLEKLIPSVKAAIPHCGQRTFDYCMGMKVGLLHMPGAKVITEIEALKALAGVDAYHVASGGSGGMQGGVILVAEGETQAVEKAIQIVESLKGEPPLMPRKETCEDCRVASPVQPKDYKTQGFPPHCDYAGKKEAQLPSFLRDL